MPRNTKEPRPRPTPDLPVLPRANARAQLAARKKALERIVQERKGEVAEAHKEMEEYEDHFQQTSRALDKLQVEKSKDKRSTKQTRAWKADQELIANNQAKAKELIRTRKQKDQES